MLESVKEWSEVRYGGLFALDHDSRMGKAA